MRATVHVGPKGGVEYRLWTGPDTFRVVGRYAARPLMSEDERAKADRMEAERKAKRARDDEDGQTWRLIARGG